MGAMRKDAALAALSSQLAGLQLHTGAGQGRRASLPETRGGTTGGQADPAVVQVRTALDMQPCGSSFHGTLWHAFHASAWHKTCAGSLHARQLLSVTIFTSCRH